MGTILLLDDEKVVRNVCRDALTNAGYKVLETANSDEAMFAAMSHPGEISLFYHQLPSAGEGVSGRDVAEEILKPRPGLPVLDVSGSRKLNCAGRGCWHPPATTWPNLSFHGHWL